MLRGIRTVPHVKVPQLGLWGAALCQNSLHQQPLRKSFEHVMLHWISLDMVQEDVGHQPGLTGRELHAKERVFVDGSLCSLVLRHSLILPQALNLTGSSPSFNWVIFQFSLGHSSDHRSAKPLGQEVAKGLSCLN